MGASGEILSRSCADHVTDAQARFHAALRLNSGQRVEIWRGAICIWEISADQLAGSWQPHDTTQQDRFLPSISEAISDL